MFNVNGVDFEIKEKGFNTSLADIKTAKENHALFLRKHTNLDDKKIEKILEVISSDELVTFVHEKLDLNNESTFVGYVNAFTDKGQSIEYMMFNALIGFGYKYTEVVTLGTKELVEAFIFEVLNRNEAINAELVKARMSKFYSEETVKAFLELTSLSAKSNKEQSELISQLENL